jgi:branched-chain amino acid transport system permease protein
VAENGTSLFGWHLDLPAGTSEIVVGVLMAAVLILRPAGLTGGRELRLRGAGVRVLRLRERRA